MRTHHHMHAVRGFSLLELAIVLIIITLVAGLGITLAGNIMSGTDRVATQQRLIVIRQALDTFVAKNGYLPCPANRALVPTDTNFGVELRSGTDCSPASPGMVKDGTGTVYIGALPTQTLGLPASYAADAWSNKLLYAVSATHIADASSYALKDGPITVRYGDLATQYDITSTATYVVVSHGPDGKGAYPLEGTAVGTACGAITTGNNIDDENCDDSNAIFYDTEYNDGSMPDSFFDDYIIWGSNALYRKPVPSTTGTVSALTATPTTTINLDANASAVTGTYVGEAINITGGTGAGQSAVITNYAGSSKTVTVPTLANPLDTTSTYSIAPTAGLGTGCAPGVCEAWCATCLNVPVYTSTATPSSLTSYVCQSTVISNQPCQANCVYAYFDTTTTNSSSAALSIPCP